MTIEPIELPYTHGNARALLADLASELPAIEGRGIDPAGRTASGPGGEETVATQRAREMRRARAVDALRRFGAMWAAGQRDEVCALWWAYVRQSDEVRTKIDAGRPGAWLEELGWQLLPLAELAPRLRASSRRGAGPEAAASRTRGATVLARAETLFETASTRGTTGGAWLAVVRDAVDARLLAYRETVQSVAAEKSAERARARAGLSTAPACAAPAPIDAPHAEPAVHPLAAVRAVEAIGFPGTALRERMVAALLAGDVATIVEAAFERGLGQSFLELCSGVTDEDREKEAELTKAQTA